MITSGVQDRLVRADVSITTAILHEHARHSRHETKHDLPRCDKIPRPR
jgi:hypothetical protein